MDKCLLSDSLNSIIEETFAELQRMYDNEGDDSRLIFPIHRGEKRVSEQELRQIFIKSFLKNENLKHIKYSVETPTIRKYRFSTKNANCDTLVSYPSDSLEAHVESANIDLVLFEGKERIAIIEFKACNPPAFKHYKDFLKLNDEDGEPLRYFIEIFNKTNEGTLKNIIDKIHGKSKSKKTIPLDESKSVFIGYSLSCKSIIYRTK